MSLSRSALNRTLTTVLTTTVTGNPLAERLCVLSMLGRSVERWRETAAARLRSSGPKALWSGLGLPPKTRICAPSSGAVPHSCQNEGAPRVIAGHSGDIRKHDDLDSGRYPCRPNKPVKEEVIRRLESSAAAPARRSRPEAGSRPHPLGAGMVSAHRTSSASVSFG